MLTEDMRRVVNEQSLGFIATVCPDGTPNLSPKGTTIAWGDEHLVFLHLYSPGTVSNLASNPAIEINVVDPLARKGYRFKGTAEVLTEGDVYTEILEFFERERGTDIPRVRAVVLMHVDSAAPLVSPAYDMGRTEKELVTMWRDRHLALADARLAQPD
jgi:predicted pyridoxine 5'-phosphate oxidase superfamily flavin-nucleotide-binding protein